jgi:hypothetical protein
MMFDNTIKISEYAANIISHVENMGLSRSDARVALYVALESMYAAEKSNGVGKMNRVIRREIGVFMRRLEMTELLQL